LRHSRPTRQFDAALNNTDRGNPKRKQGMVDLRLADASHYQGQRRQIVK
jgi:hypothetical protein